MPASKKIFLIAIGGIVLAASAYGAWAPLRSSGTAHTAGQNAERTISIAGNTIAILVADTDETREKGLSGRDGLTDNEGMLFIFPTPGLYQFWMKDMKFPIDILWLSNEGRIVSIKENISPETYPSVFGPTAPARYVLEVSAGYASRHGLKVGDSANI